MRRAYHDGRRCAPFTLDAILSTSPTLSNVRTSSLFTDRMQAEAPEILFDRGKRRTGRDFRLQM